MSGINLKLAKDLQPGDHMVINAGGGSSQLEVTVLASVESVEVTKRHVLIFTLLDPDGRQIHRQFSPNATVRLRPAPQSVAS